jgi:hypothetical protein
VADAIPASAEADVLRYSARAGLLPELSRQTYDAFYKALREVALNSLDAGARTVTIDFSQVATSGDIVVSDDGSGMSIDEIRNSFMSLGGSAKFGSPTKFGRIGIGSLALLHYGESAVVETKVAGANVVTTAHIRHPWAMDRPSRSQRLEDLAAGSVTQLKYVGDLDDHFTIIRLCGVSDAVVSDCTDVSRFYTLVDRLRRVLPLKWGDDGRLQRALERANPDTWALIRDHIEEFAGSICIRSAWGALAELRHREFGEDAAESWSGQPRLIHKTLRIPDENREFQVAAYFVAQTHVSPQWAGLTSRVQNVAVEERTFFDVESDPGFRKYLSGEVFLFGDIDRARLVNIDRASFNRECPDYRAAQRYLAERDRSLQVIADPAAATDKGRDQASSRDTQGCPRGCQGRLRIS